MRGTELLDKMELIDPAYVEAAEQQIGKKKSTWIKWTAMAACLCLVLAAALTIPEWREGGGAFAPVPDPDGPVRQEPLPQDWPEQPILRPGDPGYNTPGEEPPEATMDPGSNQIMGPSDMEELPDVTPMISAFGDMDTHIDMAVSNGGVALSRPLQDAMAHYGDGVTYQVMVELFSDGVQIPSGGELAQKEMQRLHALGYTTALETVEERDDSGKWVTTAHYFTLLFVTRDQLESFPPSETLGYSLRLYGEYFGQTEQEDVVFHGFQTN